MARESSGDMKSCTTVKEWIPQWNDSSELGPLPGNALYYHYRDIVPHIGCAVIPLEANTSPPVVWAYPGEYEVLVQNGEIAK